VAVEAGATSLLLLLPPACSPAVWLRTASDMAWICVCGVVRKSVKDTGTKSRGQNTQGSRVLTNTCSSRLALPGM
jgi:hypothetical protein